MVEALAAIASMMKDEPFPAHNAEFDRVHYLTQGSMKQRRGKTVCVVLLAVLTAAFVAAGCGSSSSGSDAPPLKKPQFVNQANSICKQADAEREQALKKVGGEEPELDELTEAVLPPLQKMTEELGELGPPKGDEEQVEAIVDAFDEGVSEVEGNSSDPTVQISAFAEADKLAVSYGLTDCVI